MQDIEARGVHVAVYWKNSLLDAAFVADRGDVGIASHASRGAELVVESDRFAEITTIVEHGPTGTVVHVPAGASGAEAGERTLEPGASLVWQLDDLRYEVRSGPRPRPMDGRREIDWDHLRVFAMSVMAHAFFVTAAWLTPAPGTFGVRALVKAAPTFDAERLRRAKPAEPKPAAILAGRKDAGRHEGDEGRFGEKKGRPKDAAVSRRRATDLEIVRNTGLLSLFNKGGAGAVSTVLDGAGLGNGINEALGGLRGTALTDASGLGGMGSRGSGAGGSGRSLGIGGIRTGSGRGEPGGSLVSLGGAGKHVVPVAPKHSQVKVGPGLKRYEISRVIQQNLNRFRYCYEKELNANPNLMGKTSVRFTIAPTGSVAIAHTLESTVGSTKVDRCFVDVMRTLKFPKPRGGGIVVVTYPFTLAST